MNRYFVSFVAALTISIAAVAVAFALHGSSSPAAAAPAPELQDGRHFGLIQSVDLSGTPGTIVFDAADLLTGEAANQYAAAHGGEVPVANDSLVANDDPTLRTLDIAPDAEIRLMDWDRCCEPVPADRDQLAAADVQHAWGYWVTLQDGVVVKLEEQFHP
jgi:hypothetical protein